MVSLLHFQPALEPAESLHGGLCLLASAQVLTGCIKGALSFSPALLHMHRQTHARTHTHARMLNPIMTCPFGEMLRVSPCKLTSLNLFQDLSLPY